MFVDASAIVAIIMREKGYELLLTKLESSFRPTTSPIAVYEAVVAVARNKAVPVARAQADVDQFLAATAMIVVEITRDVGDLALEAFSRFGKGRHPAGLNMGDCFAYACARRLGASLLYVGEDFARTDIGAP